MLGLTHLLITSSKAIAGAATLLIRLCTLWFGLGIGVIALVLFRTTRHIDFSSVQGEMSEIEQPGINIIVSNDATQQHYKTHQCYQVLETSLYENTYYYSNV